MLGGGAEGGIGLDDMLVVLSFLVTTCKGSSHYYYFTFIASTVLRELFILLGILDSLYKNCLHSPRRFSLTLIEMSALTEVPLPSDSQGSVLL